MTDAMRVILEIGKKRRVVAGAMDWPGLDRWGTGEEAAIERLSTYRSRYVGVAERAGLAREFARSGDVVVVERVPGSSSTDFWGIAHVPSLIEDEVLPSAELERRLTLLRATWAYFDDVVGGVAGELLPSGRTYGRTREQIARHVYIGEPEQFSRKVEVRTDPGAVMTPRRPGGTPGGLPRRDPRLERGGQARPDVADPVPDPPDGPPRDGPRVGARGPGSGCDAGVVGRQLDPVRSRSSISQAWSSMCHAQRRMRNCSVQVRAISPRAL